MKPSGRTTAARWCGVWVSAWSQSDGQCGNRMRLTSSSSTESAAPPSDGRAANTAAAIVGLAAYTHWSAGMNAAATISGVSCPNTAAVRYGTLAKTRSPRKPNPSRVTT